MLEQLVQAGSGVSILGSTQNLPGHGPEQRPEPPALVSSAVSWEVGLDEVQRSWTSHLNHSVLIYQFSNENTYL